MSRSRDISKILGATEVSNTGNARLLVSGEAVGLDSAEITTIAEGQGLASYTTLDSLPVTGLTAGDQAYVQNDRRLYISNGNGWYNVALANATPYWDSEPSASYTIADSVTPLIIIAKARDSDNSDQNLLHQSTVTDSAQYLVDITRDSSVYTFTPKSQDSVGSEVTAGNLTDSNTNDFIYTFKWSDGINFVSKAVTINYNFIVDESVTDLVNRSASAGTYNITMGAVTKSVYFDGSHALYASFGTGGSLSPASTYPAWKQSLIKNSYIITNAATNGFTLTGVDHYHDGTTSGNFGSYTPKDGYFAFFNGGSDTATIDWSPDTDANNIDIDGVTQIKVIAGPGATTLNASGGYVQIQGSLGTPSSMQSAETTMTYTYSDSYSGSAPFFRIHEASGISGIHAIWFK